MAPSGVRIWGTTIPTPRLPAGSQEPRDASRAEGQIGVENQHRGRFVGSFEPDVDRSRVTAVVRLGQDLGSTVAAQPSDGVVR